MLSARTRVFHDPKARVVELVRRQKKRFALVVNGLREALTTIGYTVCVIWPLGIIVFTWNLHIGAWIADGAKP